ncbi:MAG: hypothetical protein IJL00_07080, partial [Clostridia bacterium]|nr:hypothetical protein [Clostridia bacterium]
EVVCSAQGRAARLHNRKSVPRDGERFFVQSFGIAAKATTEVAGPRWGPLPKAEATTEPTGETREPRTAGETQTATILHSPFPRRPSQTDGDFFVQVFAFSAKYA